LFRPIIRSLQGWRLKQSKFYQKSPNEAAGAASSPTVSAGVTTKEDDSTTPLPHVEFPNSKLIQKEPGNSAPEMPTTSPLDSKAPAEGGESKTSKQTIPTEPTSSSNNTSPLKADLPSKVSLLVLFSLA
jgi:hypothetical protein